MSGSTIPGKRGPAVRPPPRKAEVHRAPQNRQSPPSPEEIARRAYEIWLRRGGGAGHDAEDWAQAELELAVSSAPGDGAACESGSGATCVSEWDGR